MIGGIREGQARSDEPDRHSKRQYQLNFECRVCLKPTPVCGPKGERLWCEKHCPSHEWSHRPELKEWRCDNCEMRREEEDA